VKRTDQQENSINTSFSPPTSIPSHTC
jgi:hypothetical protein